MHASLLRTTGVCTGTWYEAGYHLATTIATPAAYAPLSFAIASLTWSGGIITLLVGIAVTWYCSILLSSLDQWDGERYVRYRDLSASIWGPWGYYGTVIFQQIASIGNNISVQIAAGISAKVRAVNFPTLNMADLNLPHDPHSLTCRRPLSPLLY